MPLIDFVSWDADGFTIDMGTIRMEDYVPEPARLDDHQRDAAHYMCRCVVVAVRPKERKVTRVSRYRIIDEMLWRIEDLWEQFACLIAQATSRLTLTWRSLKRLALHKRYLTKRWVKATRLWTALMATVNAWKPLTPTTSKNLSRFRKFPGDNGCPWLDYAGSGSEGNAMRLAAELFGLDDFDHGVDLQSTIHSEVFYRFDFVQRYIGVRGRFKQDTSYSLCFFFNAPAMLPEADGIIAAALLAASDETDFLLNMVAGHPAKEHQRMLAKMAELPDPTN